MVSETFSKSLWSALAPAAGSFPRVSGDHEVGVLVIGGGLLGLSTALHLAEQSQNVMLIEAAEAGFGASGRNSGFVVPSLRTGLGPEDVNALVGEAGERLMRLVGDSGNIVFGLAKRLAIDCSAETTGWLQPAHTPAMLDVLKQRRRDWSGLGRRVDILGAAETKEKIGGGDYPGALFDPSGGQINPLAYARGLAQAAAAAGADIRAGSKVLKIDTTGPRPAAVTAGGRVTAERILLATNALVEGLNTAVASSIVPVRVFQIATQRFHGETLKHVMPTRTPVADTRRHTFAVRWSPDDRLITGGLVLPGPGRLARAERVFLRRLRRFFPDVGPFSSDYVWTGVIAATLDSMPRFMRVGKGLDAVIGCNGRGVALTTSLGREIAGLYSGSIKEKDFPLPIAAPRPIAGHMLVRHGPSIWLPWSDLRDRLDSGRAL